MSPLTIDSHKRKLSRFETYCLEQELTALGDISPSTIKNFLASMRVTYHLDTATVNRYLVTLKAFWRWLLEEGYATSNPCSGIKLGKQQTKVVKGLNQQQIALLLSNLKDRKLQDARDKAIIYVLLDSGLRVGELAKLSIEDVDLSRGTLLINGKGSKQRLVPIGLRTRKALNRYLLLRRSIEGGQWLWVNQRGQKLTTWGIQEMVSKLGNKLGITGLHPHLLRHTYAITFLRNGANVFELQASLGHSTLEMSRKYCQALSFEDVQRRHRLASPVDNAFRT